MCVLVGQAAKESLKRSSEDVPRLVDGDVFTKVLIGDKVFYLSKKHSGWTLGMGV